MKLYVPEVATPTTDSVATDRIVFWGHSAGRILEPLLEEELKDNLSIAFRFEKCSVDSETMLQIAARQGSLPARFYGSHCVLVRNRYRIADGNYPFRSSFDGTSILFSIVNGVNPCEINNVSGILSKEGNAYYFEPSNNAQFTLQSINLINTASSVDFRFPLFSLFWCDQISDREDLGALLEKYKRMVEFTGNSYYLIIGSIRGDALSHKIIEQTLTTTFNDHFFNARAFLASEAKKDEASFSASDRARIAKGSVPWVWMRDEKHLNSTGALILAKEVANILKARIVTTN